MEELYIEKFKAWFAGKYGELNQDNALKCFMDYCTLVQGSEVQIMDVTDVTRMLTDAGIGGIFFSSHLIASQVLEYFGLSEDGFTWEEALSVKNLLPNG